MLVLFTDTDTDITLDEAKKYGYHLISMPYSIDGEIFYPYESWIEFDAHEFYDKLRSGIVPKTSSISEEKYINYFEPFLKNGDDIFYIHFSRNMTTTFNAMDKAVEKLQEKYPERKIYTVDTNAITILSLNIVKEVGEMFKAGKTPEEVIEWVEKERGHFALYFFSDSLKFFKHSGRVSNLTGTMGTMLGIRPIIYINDDGKMLSIGKEKGRFKATERLIRYVEELGEDLDQHRIIIGATDNEELVNEVKNLLVEKFGENLKIETHTINPTIGSHCGPDSVGICFYAKNR